MPDFIAKMSIVEEEADECGYWPELLAESNRIPYDRPRELMAERDGLVAIAATSINTAKARNTTKL